MKKLYLDETQAHECMSIFIKDAEIIHAGTTIYSMSVKDKNAEYERYADEYDIHFIFDDDIPHIDFYTIPQVDIMATDSQGGFIGTIGEITDLESDAPICYIDKDRNCYLIAENAKDFLKCTPMWKSSLKEYNGVTFYNSKSDAEKDVEFLDWIKVDQRENKYMDIKMYALLIVGIIELIISFVWMVISRSSTGLYLILAFIGGATIKAGIDEINNKI